MTINSCLWTSRHHGGPVIVDRSPIPCEILILNIASGISLLQTPNDGLKDVLYNRS